MLKTKQIAHPDIDSMANNDCQEINDILIETDDKQTEQDISFNLMKDHANRNLWYVRSIITLYIIRIYHTYEEELNSRCV